MDFAVPAGHRVKLKGNEKKYKNLDLARGLKKLLNMKVTVIPVVIGALGTVTKRLVQGLRNKRMSGDYSNYCFIEISQNAGKGSGDLWRLVVTYTPVRNHRLMLVCKTLKRVK